jgi:hypothetical protein
MFAAVEEHQLVRNDRDSWDLATSVGATATMVAVQRALASSQPYEFDRRFPR